MPCNSGAIHRLSCAINAGHGNSLSVGIRKLVSTKGFADPVGIRSVNISRDIPDLAVKVAIMSSGASGKGDTTPSPTSEKGQLHSHSIEETPAPGKVNVHYVKRDGENSLPEYEGEHIPGYDANLMRARATLSSTEEKKLLRRIDWHLIPLLSVMYMVKTVDYANVISSEQYQIDLGRLC